MGSSDSKPVTTNNTNNTNNTYNINSGSKNSPPPSQGSQAGAATTSTTDIANKQNYSNKNIFEDTLSKMNESTVNVFQSSSKTSSATIYTSQSTSIGNVIASGRGSVANVTLNQSSKNTLNFKDVDTSRMASDVITQAAQAASTMLSTEFTLKSDNDLSSKNKLDTSSQSQSTSLGGSSPPSNSSSTTNSNTKISNDISVENETQTRISEFMKNKLETTIKQEDIQTCIANIVASQNLSGNNFIASDGGIVNFNASQSIEALLDAQCSHFSESMNKALEDFKQNSNLDYKNKSDTSTETKESSDTTATTSSAAGSFGLGGPDSMGSTIIISIIIGIFIFCCISSILKYSMNSDSSSNNTE